MLTGGDGFDHLVGSDGDDVLVNPDGTADGGQGKDRIDAGPGTTPRSRVAWGTIASAASGVTIGSPATAEGRPGRRAGLRHICVGGTGDDTFRGCEIITV